MSMIEDRLTAALNARADLVQLEDLRPSTPPATVTPLRRPAPWLLAAAACALLVGVPAVVMNGDGDDEPAPPTLSPTATVTPNGDEVEGADWPEVYQYKGYDVDADGEQDRLVTRTKSGKDLTDAPWRMEVQLSSGGTTAILLDYDSYDIGAISPVDLDGDGGDEIVYYRGTETDEIGVLQYAADGALHDLAVPGDPGITNQLDDRGRIRTWWADEAGAAFFSSTSVEGGYTMGDGGKPWPQGVYEVDVYRWTVADGALVAVDEGTRCVRQGAEHRPYECGGAQTPPPGTQPEASDSVGVGEPFQVDLSGDGRPDTVVLEGPVDTASVDDGEVLLVVSLAGGGELQAPVPAGWTPRAFTTAYDAPGTPGLLVEQEGGDQTPMTLYVIRGDELVAAEVRGPYFFGNGFDGPAADVRTETYLTAEGTLLMRRTPVADLEDDWWQFYAWGLQDTSLVVEEEYAAGCWEC